MANPKPIKYELKSGERAHEAAAQLSEIFAGVARVTAVPIHLGAHHIEDWGSGIRHGEGFGLEARSMHQSRTIFQMARVFEDSARRDIYIWVQRTSAVPEDREILRRAQMEITDRLPSWGLDRSELVAGNRTGAYTWAKDGYELVDHPDHVQMQSTVGQRVMTLRRYLRDDVCDDMQGMADAIPHDPRALWHVADAPYDLNDPAIYRSPAHFAEMRNDVNAPLFGNALTQHYHDRFPIAGFILSTGIKWHGVLRVGDAAPMQRHTEFCRQGL